MAKALPVLPPGRQTVSLLANLALSSPLYVWLFCLRSLSCAFRACVHMSLRESQILVCLSPPRTFPPPPSVSHYHRPFLQFAFAHFQNNAPPSSGGFVCVCTKPPDSVYLSRSRLVAFLFRALQEGSRVDFLLRDFHLLCSLLFQRARQDALSFPFLHRLSRTPGVSGADRLPSAGPVASVHSSAPIGCIPLPLSLS